MAGINKVILIGNLGKDPDIRTFETGVKKASFTLATSEIRKDKDGNRVELTECWEPRPTVRRPWCRKWRTRATTSPHPTWAPLPTTRMICRSNHKQLVVNKENAV